MKILQITPETPGNFSGGTLGIWQTLQSLQPKINNVDYIGPPIPDSKIKSLYNRTFELEKNKNPLLAGINLMRGITNKSYENWKKLKINYTDYDVIVLDFAKQDYILEKVPKDKLIVRCHNVEKDYALRANEFEQTFKSRIIAGLAAHQENKLLKNARHIVPITKEDSDRLNELYKLNDVESTIVPVCVENQIIDLNKREDNTLIITGSLWFGANYEGIMWFINNVYVKLSSTPKLIIAGSHPNDQLKECIKKHSSIELIDTPVTMKPYFERASLSIAPVFDGAGMKVKVAEALSYGVPVVGTEHAFTGYNIKSGNNSFLCKTAEEFIKEIEKYLSLNRQQKQAIQKNAKNLYDKCYSLTSSKVKWNQILNSVAYKKEE